MTNQQRPTLGQKVRFTHYVEKQDANKERWKLDPSEPYLKWDVREARKITHFGNDGYVDGFFIGKRTWSIGNFEEVKVYDYDDHSENAWVDFETRYRPMEYREVWLVVFHPSRNPVAVFPEHCEVIE